MRSLIALIVTLLFVLSGCNADESTIGTESRVIFRSDDGRVLTAADLAEATGVFDYGIMANQKVPDKANELHQRARQLGAAGEYGQAIELLSQAQLLAPEWPYPTYDIAFTYLLMKDFDKARRNYEATVKMAPRGFFTAVTALDTLNREATGDLPKGTYAAYTMLEWIDDPAEKSKMVKALVQRIPHFAPAWKEYALQCDDLVEKLKALEKGLAANPDAETEGMLLINKALTLNQQGDQEAAKNILGNLALDPNATLGSEQLAKQSLSMLDE